MKRRKKKERVETPQVGEKKREVTEREKESERRGGWNNRERGEKTTEKERERKGGKRQGDEEDIAGE